MTEPASIIPTPVVPIFVPAPAGRRVRPRLSDFHLFFLRYRPFMAQLESDRDRCNRVLKWLSGERDDAKRRNRVRKFLSDQTLHRVCAFYALTRADGLHNATPESVLSLAAQFNAFRPVTDEPWFTREVTRGLSVRQVQDFGPKRRMHQRAVHLILRALHPPLESQKLFRGGIPKAHRAIEAAVDEGNRFGTEVDFVRFYATIKPERLSDLLRPLPSSVVHAVVWDDAVRAHGPIHASGAAPEPASSSFEGLSLGSACSPIVGETIIADLLWAAGLRDVVTFADNLFVYGRSEEDVAAKCQALRDVVESHPLGELEISVPRDYGYGLEFPFDFAKQTGVLRGEAIHWMPGARALERFQISEAPHVTFEQLEVAERKAVAWRRAYPDWHDGDAHVAEYRAALAARRYYLSRHPQNLQRAVEAVIVAYCERLVIEPDFPGSLIQFVPVEGDILGDARGRLIGELRRHIDRWQMAVSV